jgi:hypothetical protein
LWKRIVVVVVDNNNVAVEQLLIGRMFRDVVQLVSQLGTLLSPDVELL